MLTAQQLTHHEAEQPLLGAARDHDSESDGTGT